MCRFCLNTCSHIVWSTVIWKEPLSSCSIHYFANLILSFSSGEILHAHCRISIIACVRVCVCARAVPAVLSFSVFLFFVFGMCWYVIGVWWHWVTQFFVCISVFQDRGIANTSLSTFGAAQAVLEILLILYPFSDPPSTLLFVRGRSSMLHGQEQHCPASFVYPGHTSARHLPEDMLGFFITFYHRWKGADFGYLKNKNDNSMKLLCSQQKSVSGPWLICWTATWWCRLWLASIACGSLRDSLPGRMTQPWQR